MNAEKWKTKLYSFPFVVFVDSRNPPEVTLITSGESRFRIYPPFRSAPANWIPMPPINSLAIPYLPGHKPTSIRKEGTLMSVSAHPLLDRGQADQAVLTSFELEWETKEKPIHFPMDSLRIDIFADSANTQIDTKANLLVKDLLSHTRSLTGQWWISRSSDTYTGWLRNEFASNSFGDPSSEVTANVSGQTASGIEFSVDSTLWRRAVELTESGEKPLISQQLLLDAWYFRASSDYRRMILDAATACEISKDSAFERQWSRKFTGQYRKSKAMNGWDLPAHLSRDLANLCGRSFETESPVIFRELEALWDARGNVAHGQMAFFRRDGERILLTESNSVSLLNAARSCVDWLEKF